jgi:hypothetical protein
MSWLLAKSQKMSKTKPDVISKFQEVSGPSFLGRHRHDPLEENIFSSVNHTLGIRCEVNIWLMVIQMSLEREVIFQRDKNFE